MIQTRPKTTNHSTSSTPVTSPSQNTQNHREPQSQDPTQNHPSSLVTKWTIRKYFKFKLLISVKLFIFLRTVADPRGGGGSEAHPLPLFKLVKEKKMATRQVSRVIAPPPQDKFLDPLLVRRMRRHCVKLLLQ